MPELPEVEAMRKQVERQLRGATITSVDARESGGGPRTGKFDSIVIGERVKEQTFVKTLQNRRITAVKRIGKQIWLELSGDGAHLLFHCGMTGCLSVEGAKRLKFQYFGKGKEWPPKFTKLQLVCKKKGAPGNKSKRLVFFDPRRLGRILLREQPRSEPPICHLAPDPLVELPRLDVFCEVLSKSNMPVKAVLLDQTKLVAGVGNWVADEVLHAARIHPAAIAKTLSKAQVASLRRSISSIVRAAVKVDADAERFPKKWLFHKRWQAGSQRRDVQLPGHGGTLVFRTVAGRTTALVPSRQKMGLLASSGRPRRQQQQQQQKQQQPKQQQRQQKQRQQPAREQQRQQQGQVGQRKGKQSISRQRPRGSTKTKPKATVMKAKRAR